MGEWADLSIDILSLIILRLPNFDDFVVAGAVCKSWRLAIASLEKPSLPPKFPWLMLAEEDNKRGQRSIEEAIQTRGFFSLLDNKTYVFELSEAVGRNCFGTSFGWLLSLGEDLQISLLHPMSKCQVSLPPQPTFGTQADPDLPKEAIRDIYVRKAVLSANPLKLGTQDYDPNCVIMTIYGEVSLLAFARIGDKAWTDVPTPSPSYSDIVYHRGKFYAVDCHGVTFVCDIDDGQNPKATAIAGPPPGTVDWIKKYLVESSGQLLLVSRIFGGRCFTQQYVEDGHYFEDYGLGGENSEDEELEDEGSELDSEDDDPYVTIGFLVMKLVENTEGSRYEYKLEKVDDLGDQALFVGLSSSISLSASSFPGCKANCIYFTDDYLELFYGSAAGGGNDMGIFSMADATIKHHYTGQSLSYFTAPMWYI